MKEASSNKSICTYLTLDYLYKKGTVAIVEKTYNKLKLSLNQKVIEKLDNEENMPIYLTYYMLYKFPLLNEKLATFTDSFEREIKTYINIIFNEFIEIFINIKSESDECIINIYKEAFSEMFNEKNESNIVKKRIGDKIHRAALIYLMSGKNVYINLLGREIDENEIENYIYNDINCLDSYLKIIRIIEIKQMSIDECKDYVENIIESISLYDISSDILDKLISLEKTKLFEIIITSDEQLKTIENNRKAEFIRSGK